MSNHPNDYIKPELMACCGAREIRDGDIVVVGTGFPAMSANIARYTHAPKATLMQESGVFDARPARPALSRANSAAASSSVSCSPWRWPRAPNC